MVNTHDVSIATLPAGERHLAAGHCPDRGAARCGEIDTLMGSNAFQDGVEARGGKHRGNARKLQRVTEKCPARRGAVTLALLLRQRGKEAERFALRGNFCGDNASALEGFSLALELFKDDFEGIAGLQVRKVHVPSHVSQIIDNLYRHPGLASGLIEAAVDPPTDRTPEQGIRERLAAGGYSAVRLFFQYEERALVAFVRESCEGLVRVIADEGKSYSLSQRQPLKFLDFPGPGEPR